ncbi:hypothetical protein BB560_004104, partial [Smittium megazygosporum]
MELKSVLIPIGTYGGELFGMSEQRCKPIQRVADNALHIIANVGKSAPMHRIRQEMGVTSINTRASDLRERAYFKYPTLRTWISDLVKQTIRSQTSTWVTGTARWMKRYCQTVGRGNTVKVLQYRYTVNDKTKISAWIKAHNMRNTGSWMDLQMRHPDIKLGLQDIGKIQMGCYWTAQRLAKSGLIPKMYIERCPFCNKNTPETIEHMLIECFRWNSIKHETTIFNIPRLYRTVTIDQSTNNQVLSQGRKIMVGKLLGGESKETRSIYELHPRCLNTYDFYSDTIIINPNPLEPISGGYGDSRGTEGGLSTLAALSAVNGVPSQLSQNIPVRGESNLKQFEQVRANDDASENGNQAVATPIPIIVQGAVVVVPSGSNHTNGTSVTEMINSILSTGKNIGEMFWGKHNSTAVLEKIAANEPKITIEKGSDNNVSSDTVDDTGSDTADDTVDDTASDTAD